MRKRTVTRSKTAAVCPFKSFGARAVLDRLKGGGEVSVLVAQDHGDHFVGMAGAGNGGAIMLVKESAHEKDGGGRRREPAELEFGLRMGGGGLFGENAGFKLRRRAPWRPRAQLHLQWVRIVHKTFLSNGL